MYTYQWHQWLAFFYIYCFFGWIFESAYVSLKKRHFVNRGFLRLPMLPLYGTGAVMMLWVSLPVKDNLFLVYLSGVVAATALEYATGWLMERLFKMKYWDYRSQRFQLNGYICLSSSIAWGFLTIFLTEVIHQPVARLVLALKPSVEIPLLAVVSAFFAADTVQSTREALALGKALEAMTKMKAELEDMQVQLALLRAETSQKVEDMRSDARHRVSEWKSDAAVMASELRQEARLKAAKLTDLKEEARLRAMELKGDAHLRAAELKEEAAARIAQEVAELPPAAAEKIRVLSQRHQELLETRRKLTCHMSLYRKSLLRGNPSASSKKFADALKELRDITEQR